MVIAQQECLFGPFPRGIWCQRRDSNSQTPVSKTGRYSNSRTLALLYEGYAAKTSGYALANCSRGTALALAHLVHRGGFEPPSPQEDSRVTAGPFKPDSRTCANLAEGRRIERPWLITMPWFSGPVAGHSAVPSAWRRVRESNPLASCESPCLADKCLTVRPTLRLYEGSATFCCCALANCSRDPALALAHL